MTELLAFSTSGGNSFNTFLSASCFFSFAISSCTFFDDCACRSFSSLDSLVCEDGVRASGRAEAAAPFIFEAVDSVGGSEGSGLEESLARTDSRVSVSRFWILSSSAATRSAMWSSRVLAREEFVCRIVSVQLRGLV